MITKKNFWPAGIIIVFAVFFLYLFGFLIFSQMHKSDLVTENYYDEEMAYQQQIDRIERSRSLSRDIELRYEPEAKTVTLGFPPELNHKTISGNILFFRPSDAAQDHMHPLKPDSKGKQIFRVNDLSEGLWRVKIFWQTGGVEYYHEKSLTVE